MLYPTNKMTEYITPERTFSGSSFQRARRAWWVKWVQWENHSTLWLSFQLLFAGASMILFPSMRKTMRMKRREREKIIFHFHINYFFGYDKFQLINAKEPRIMLKSLLISSKLLFCSQNCDPIHSDSSLESLSSSVTDNSTCHLRPLQRVTDWLLPFDKHVNTVQTIENNVMTDLSTAFMTSPFGSHSSVRFGYNKR